ncbi:MAG: Ig-like domain-containing protein [Planctomycetota bacterium]
MRLRQWLNAVFTRLNSLATSRRRPRRRYRRNVYYASTVPAIIETLEARRLLSGVTAAPDSFMVVHDHELNNTWGSVLQNDSGYDDTMSGSMLVASQVSGPGHGTLSLNSNGTFQYTPDAGYVGTDSFTYAASIGGATATASVSISVLNNAPYLYTSGSTFMVSHDHTFSTGWPVVSAYDIDGDR